LDTVQLFKYRRESQYFLSLRNGQRKHFFCIKFLYIVFNVSLDCFFRNETF